MIQHLLVDLVRGPFRARLRINASSSNSGDDVERRALPAFASFGGSLAFLHLIDPAAPVTLGYDDAVALADDFKRAGLLLGSVRFGRHF